MVEKINIRKESTKDIKEYDKLQISMIAIMIIDII